MGISAEAKLYIEVLLRNAQGAVSQVNQLGGSFQTLGNRMVDSGRRLEWTGRRMFVGITLPLIGIGVQVARTALDFDQSMAKVASAAALSGDVTNEMYQKLSQSAINASKDSVFSAKEMAQALYELVSAGFTAEQSMNMLGNVAQFAQGAQIDLATAVNYGAASLKAFGPAGYDMARIFDITSVAVQGSLAHFPEFIHAMEVSAGAGRTAGQSFEQLSAAIMVMSDRGVVAGRMGFYLRAIMQTLGKPTAAAAKKMQELGLSFTDAEGKIKPLGTIAKEFGNRLSTVGSQQERLNILTTIFNRNAATGFIPIMEAASGKTAMLSEEILKQNELWDIDKEQIKNTSKSFDEYLSQLSKAQGATKRLSDEVKQTYWAQFRIAINNLNAVLIELGYRILPIVTPWILKLAVAAQNALNWFEGLSPTMKKLIIGFGLFVTAMGPVIMYFGLMKEGTGVLINMFTRMTGDVQGASGALRVLFGLFSGQTVGWLMGAGKQIDFIGTASGKLIPASTTLATAFKAIGSALGTWALPIGIIVAALASMYIAFKDNFWGLKDKFLEATTSIREAWSEFVDALDKALQPLGGLKVVLGYVWQGFLWLVKAIGFLLAMPIVQFLDGLAKVIKILAWQVEAFNMVMDWMRSKLELLREPLAKFIDKAIEVGKTIKEYLTDKFQPLAEAIDNIKKKWDEFVEKLEQKKTQIQVAIEGIKKLFQDLFSGKISPEQFLTAIRDALQKVKDYMWREISEPFKQLGSIKIDFSKVFEPFKRIGEFIGKIDFGKIFSGIGDFFKDLPGKFREGFSKGFEAIKSLDFSKLFAGAGGVADQAKKTGENIPKNIKEGAESKQSQLIQDIVRLLAQILIMVGIFVFIEAGKMGVNIIKSIGEGMWSMAKGLGDSLKSIFSDAWNSVKGKLSEWGNDIGNFFRELPSKIATTLGTMAGAIAGAFSSIGTTIAMYAQLAWNWLVTTLTTTITNIGIWLASLPGIVATWLTGLYNTVMFWANAAWNWLVTMLPVYIDMALAWLASLPGRAATWLASLANTVLVWATNAYNNLVDWITNAVNSAISWLSQLPDRAAGAMSSLADTVGNGARDAWQRFTDWINKLPGAISDALSNTLSSIGSWGGKLGDRMHQVASEMWSEFKRGLGISSPSYIERAMTAIEQSTLQTLYTMKNAIPRINSFANMGTSFGDTTTLKPMSVGGETTTYEISYNLNPGLVIASDGELREFYRKMKQMEMQESRRVTK